MARTLHLAVRTLHVLGMVGLLGGAVALWYLARRGADSVTTLAADYEWLFWGAVGVMVVTGVGNLGALGAPGPDTRWGTILLAKLLLVVAFVLGSLVRTLAVALADANGALPDANGALGPAFHRRAYGATAAVLLALVALAEVLAHG